MRVWQEKPLEPYGLHIVVQRPREKFTPAQQNDNNASFCMSSAPSSTLIEQLTQGMEMQRKPEEICT